MLLGCVLRYLRRFSVPVAVVIISRVRGELNKRVSPRWVHGDACNVTAGGEEGDHMSPVACVVHLAQRNKNTG